MTKELNRMSVTKWRKINNIIPPEVRHIVGIDPSKGFAIYHRKEKELMTVKTTTFWGIIKDLEYMVNHIGADKFAVYIEDVRNPRVWQLDKKLKGKKNFTENEVRYYCGVARNVGKNHEDCEKIIEWCKINKVQCVPVPPTKASNTKLGKEKFNNITGWKVRTSEHGRDAAMLCWLK